MLRYVVFLFFFFNDTATTEIYTLSLHDALPIFDDHRDRESDQLTIESVHDDRHRGQQDDDLLEDRVRAFVKQVADIDRRRSEEHTSELQSRLHLVCRLLLEKKNRKLPHRNTDTY